MISFIVDAKIDMEMFPGMKARSIGPANMSGRIAAIEVVRDDRNVIYVGTATGGLWKSGDGGITWNPIFDDQSTSSIGAVAVFQENPRIVWVGTGEPLPRNSSGVGRGVFRSLDGGRTWDFLGLEKTEKIAAIRLDPNDPDVAYVAALGTTWGENAERGVFKTIDGGKTWEKILYVDERTGAAALVMAPNNPNRLIAAMWEHRRWPWFFKSGGPGSGMYITGDAGLHWKKLTEKDGLPAGELGRIGLAFATSKPDIVYALVEATRSVLLRSRDGGFTWTVVNREHGISNRPFYYSHIWVNPVNENIVYLLASQFKYSEDGGRTFSERANWGQAHSDYHAMWIHPDGEFMVVGNDGGVVMTNDRGNSWRFVSNLPLGQFYHVSVDLETPYNVYGGLQDNGSWRGPAYSLVERDLYSYRWKTVGGGDGFDTEPDPSDSACGYGMSQGGTLYRFDTRSGISRSIVPTESDVKHRYNWNAGFAVDPFEPGTIYLGSQFVHRSRDRGETWEIISPDLTTNDPAKQQQDRSGGLTLDVTNAENHTTILCIAPSPVQQGIIWVSTDDGLVQLTRDGGETWERVSDAINRGLRRGDRVPAGTHAPHVEASGFDAGTAFVVFDDHRRANWTPYAFATGDFGKTWRRLVTPDIDGFAHVIRQDRVARDLLFMGTEFGLFFSVDGGNSWTKWTRGLPTVPVRDVAIHPREHDLVIGTHGRSVYVIDDISPLRELSGEIMTKRLHLFAVPEAIQFQRGRLGSFSSPGDAEFKGENKTFGARLTYFLNPLPDTEDRTAKPQDGPPSSSWIKGRPGGPHAKETNVKITITDAQGHKVRGLDGTEETGINRVTWDLTHDAPPPPPSIPAYYRRFFRGLNALPGTYTVKITYRDAEAEATFSVVSDPRLAVDETVLEENFAMGRSVQALSTTLTRAQKRIAATRKLIGTIRATAAEGKTPELKVMLKAGDALEKKLVELAEIINPDTSKVQGIIDRSKGLSPQVRWLGFAAGRSHLPLTQAVKVKYGKVREEVDRFLDTFNRFYSEDVAAFQKSVEASGFSLFKPFEPLGVEDAPEKKAEERNR